MLKIFIGWDPRQPVSYHVLAHSIMENSSCPVAISPLRIETLPLERTGLTPFTFSRFLVPYLCDFKGHALFLDADMLCLGDITELFTVAEDKPAWVVKNPIKFEWASLILFNCGHVSNEILTPEYIEKAKSLHKLDWLEEYEVGELPQEWNFCVGYDEHREDQKLIHFTQGVPVWPETYGPGREYDELWVTYAKSLVSAKPWVELMGNSVHARPVVERLYREGKLKEKPKFMEKADG